MADNRIAADRVFMEAALSFIEGTLMTAEAVRLLPRILAELISASRQYVNTANASSLNLLAKRLPGDYHPGPWSLMPCCLLLSSVCGTRS